MKSLIIIFATTVLAGFIYTASSSNSEVKESTDYEKAIKAQKDIAKKATVGLRTAVANIRSVRDTVIKEVPITKVERVVERIHDTVRLVKYVKVKETRYTGNKYLGKDLIKTDTLK